MKKSRKVFTPKEEAVSSEKINTLLSILDKIATRLDVEISILLDILLLNDRYSESASYTDKAVYLESLGLQIDEISRIVGRPSNWVSSRLRESKTRKSSRRKQKNLRKFGVGEKTSEQTK